MGASPSRGTLRKSSLDCLSHFLRDQKVVLHIALSNYEAGRRLEYRVRDMFRRNGFFVVRAAQSKPIDLVCLRGGRSVLVECKAGRSFLSKKRRQELLDLAHQAGAAVVLARRRRRKVELTNLEDGRSLELGNLSAL